MTFKEFSGKNVEEAIRAAMKEFGADLGDLEPVEVPERAGGALDAVADGLVDPLGGGSDDLGDAVGAVGHALSSGRVERGSDR